MRYSLAALFALVGLCAVICAIGIWLGRLPKDPVRVLLASKISVIRFQHPERIALSIGPESKLSVEALNASFSLDEPVKELVVTGRTWSSDLQPWYRQRRTLEKIRFRNCDGFDPEFTTVLKELRRLNHLELRACDLSTVVLPSQLSLRTLVLDNSNITNDQMEPLSTYQSLVHFSANETTLTDIGLASLLELQLQTISIIDTPVCRSTIIELLNNDCKLIEVSERQFAYDGFSRHPAGRRVIIHDRNWLKGKSYGTVY
jgi:hypothetical protein